MKETKKLSDDQIIKELENIQTFLHKAVIDYSEAINPLISSTTLLNFFKRQEEKTILNSEQILIEGRTYAILLCRNLLSMQAESCEIPVTLEGEKYLLSASVKQNTNRS
jgi:hypothetical protein